MFLNFIKLVLIIFIVFLLFSPLFYCVDNVLAEPKAGSEVDTEPKAGSKDGTEPKAGSSPPPKLTNPLGTDNVSIPELIGRIIKAVLGVVGSIALAMFVYGGFLWMTSSGNADLVKRGKDTLIWASIGLVAIFAAYAAVHFIITKGILGG